MDDRQASELAATPRVIQDICDLAWDRLTEAETTDLAWAYYFFSVQFRENLETARALHPDDERLMELARGECDTDNLSPWPGVAAAGERMDHDEFMRRLLALSPISRERTALFREIGEAYLAQVRGLDPLVRAMGIASYEDGGLERVFHAMLKSSETGDPLIRAFRHFLSEHIRFDSDADAGHGALARHLCPDDRVLPLWAGFRRLLIAFVPGLEARALDQAA